MVLRIFTISTIVSVLLFAIFTVFIRYNSPFDMQEIQNIIETNQISDKNEGDFVNEIISIRDEGLLLNIVSTQFYIALGLLFTSIGVGFFGVHVFIDKLLFKKFFEAPNFHKAIFRSVLLPVALLITSILLLYQVPTYIFLLLGVFFILIEVGVSSFLFSNEAGSSNNQEVESSDKSAITIDPDAEAV